MSGSLFNIDPPSVDKEEERPDGYWIFTVKVAKGQRDAAVKDPDPRCNQVETFTKSNTFSSALLGFESSPFFAHGVEELIISKERRLDFL